MSNYDQGQLEKALRKRCTLESQGRNPPPQLHLHNLATRYGLSVEEVIERIEAMRQPKDQP